MKITDYDWERIKEDYIENDVTLGYISDKYGISKTSVSRHSSDEGWVDEKKRRNKAAARRRIANASDEPREKLERLREISDVITEKIIDAVSDERQFNRYIVSEKALDDSGKAVTVMNERYFDKLDIKSLREMTSTLKVLSECVKELYDIPSDASQRETENDGGLSVRFVDCAEYAD